jgi:hypothetical protein
MGISDPFGLPAVLFQDLGESSVKPFISATVDRYDTRPRRWHHRGFQSIEALRKDAQLLPLSAKATFQLIEPAGDLVELHRSAHIAND